MEKRIFFATKVGQFRKTTSGSPRLHSNAASLFRRVFVWILPVTLGISTATAVPQSVAQSESATCVRAPELVIVESLAIAKSNGTVRRNRCVLSIQGHELKDNFSDDGAYIRYDYEGMLTGTEFHLVSVHFYEGSAFELLGQLSRSRLVGKPVLSPDRRRIVASSLDLYAGYNPNAVEVFNIEKGGIRLEISLRSGQWGPSDVQWVDAETVVFSETFLDDKNLEIQRKGARLHHSSAGWSFEPPRN